jgi:small subunit ribosomal protein S20
VPISLTEDPSAVANIKSQIKRIKTNEKARLRNKSVKSSLKTAVRKFREATDSGDATAATEALKAACRQLDKAASKGVIHANQAANRKSGMAKYVEKATEKAAEKATAAAK